MKNLILIIALSALASPVIAADNFGNRFGNSSPYALENNVGNAIADTQGFDTDDLNDLNAISPAAGSASEIEAVEDGQATEVSEEAELIESDLTEKKDIETEAPEVQE